MLAEWRLTDLLSRTFGPNAQLVESHGLVERDDYRVFFIRLDHPALEIIVKIAGPHAELDAEFDRTAQLHRLIAANTHVPIAEIIADDVSYAVFPYRYLIQRAVRGERWATLRSRLAPDEARRAYQQLGQAVAELHTIALPAFGELSFDTAPPRISYPDTLLSRADKTIAAEHLKGLFRSVIEDRRDLFASITQPTLCHDDLHHYNVLFDEVNGHWRLTGIIDFDKAYAGCGESDLARLDLWDNMMGDGFREAYREVRPIDAGYEQRRPIYQLLWCLEYAELTSRHLEDTRRVCNTLGIEFPGFSA